MAIAAAPTKTTEVSIAEAKARFSEIVRRAELNHERIVVTRRGKAVAEIVPVQAPAETDQGDWVTRAWGLLADAPEVVDAIDEVYRARQTDMPRELHFPWDNDE